MKLPISALVLLGANLAHGAAVERQSCLKEDEYCRVGSARYGSCCPPLICGHPEAHELSGKGPQIQVCRQPKDNSKSGGTGETTQDDRLSGKRSDDLLLKRAEACNPNGFVCTSDSDCCIENHCSNSVYKERWGYCVYKMPKLASPSCSKKKRGEECVYGWQCCSDSCFSIQGFERRCI